MRANLSLYTKSRCVLSCRPLRLFSSTQLNFHIFQMNILEVDNLSWNIKVITIHKVLSGHSFQRRTLEKCSTRGYTKYDTVSYCQTRPITLTVGVRPSQRPAILTQASCTLKDISVIASSWLREYNEQDLIPVVLDEGYKFLISFRKRFWSFTS